MAPPVVMPMYYLLLRIGRVGLVCCKCATSTIEIYSKEPLFVKSCVFVYFIKGGLISISFSLLLFPQKVENSNLAQFFEGRIKVKNYLR